MIRLVGKRVDVLRSPFPSDIYGIMYTFKSVGPFTRERHSLTLVTLSYVLLESINHLVSRSVILRFEVRDPEKYLPLWWFPFIISSVYVLLRSSDGATVRKAKKKTLLNKTFISQVTVIRENVYSPHRNYSFSSGFLTLFFLPIHVS